MNFIINSHLPEFDKKIDYRLHLAKMIECTVQHIQQRFKSTPNGPFYWFLNDCSQVDNSYIKYPSKINSDTWRIWKILNQQSRRPTSFASFICSANSFFVLAAASNKYRTVDKMEQLRSKSYTNLKQTIPILDISSIFFDVLTANLWKLGLGRHDK